MFRHITRFPNLGSPLCNRTYSDDIYNPDLHNAADNARLPAFFTSNRIRLPKNHHVQWSDAADSSDHESSSETDYLAPSANYQEFLDGHDAISENWNSPNLLSVARLIHAGDIESVIRSSRTRSASSTSSYNGNDKNISGTEQGQSAQQHSVDRLPSSDNDDVDAARIIEDYHSYVHDDLVSSDFNFDVFEPPSHFDHHASIMARCAPLDSGFEPDTTIPTRAWSLKFASEHSSTQPITAPCNQCQRRRIVFPRKYMGREVLNLLSCKWVLPRDRRCVFAAGKEVLSRTCKGCQGF